MQITGELIDNTIVIKKSRDIGRLYNKSGIGTPTSQNTLQLDLIEGLFLIDEGKLTVFHKRKELSFQNVLKQAASHIPSFEINYLVFKDLRKRGLIIKSYDEDPEIAFYTAQKTDAKTPTRPSFIVTLSEREIIDFEKTKALIAQAEKNHGCLWFAIVDEEGDITYYDVSLIDLTGDISAHEYPKKSGFLLDNRVVVFDEQLTTLLQENEFFGKPLGDGLQLSLVEALYLVENDVLTVQQIESGKQLSKKAFKTLLKTVQPDIEPRIMVFQDLKNRGLIVKTGFKFGTHFRAYTRDPDQKHAEYLVHVIKEGFTSSCAELSRAVRLAHSVNKEIVFAQITKNHVDCIGFGRLRP
jgi:tRNA-intron endonuclease